MACWALSEYFDRDFPSLVASVQQRKEGERATARCRKNTQMTHSVREDSEWFLCDGDELRSHAREA